MKRHIETVVGRVAPAPKRQNTGKSYYAVRRGITPGIYDSWDECRKQVEKFRNASYKRFDNKEAAVLFCDAVDVVKTDIEPPTDAVRVFSDGACKGNGKTSAVAGVGVWFGKDDERNLSEPLVGPATNQRAELTAGLRALQIVRKSTPPEDVSKTKIVVYTDSKYLTNGITSWILAWKRNAWRKADNKPVLNVDLWKAIDEEARDRDISWVWVRGHSGVLGNEEADKLADLACKQQG